MVNYHILAESANGVRDAAGKYYPFRIATFLVTGSLPAKDGIAYYVKDVYHCASNHGAFAGGCDKVEMVLDGATVIVSQVTPCTTFAASNESVFVDVPVGVLGDIRTAVTVTVASEVPFIRVKYARVDETPGVFGR